MRGIHTSFLCVDYKADADWLKMNALFRSPEKEKRKRHHERSMTCHEWLIWSRWKGKVFAHIINDITKDRSVRLRTTYIHRARCDMYCSAARQPYMPAAESYPPAALIATELFECPVEFRSIVVIGVHIYTLYTPSSLLTGVCLRKAFPRPPVILNSEFCFLVVDYPLVLAVLCSSRQLVICVIPSRL